MDENKFWVRIVETLAFLVIVIVITINVFQSRTDSKMIEMVKAGASPEAAYCALRGTQELTCAARRANGR